MPPPPPQPPQTTAGAQNHTEVEQSAWVDRDGEAAAQDNLTGCTRERSFIIPKSSMVAATRAESHEVVLADGGLISPEFASDLWAATYGMALTLGRLLWFLSQSRSSLCVCLSLSYSCSID